VRRARNLTRPSLELRGICEVHDHWMPDRTSFDLEYPPHRCFVFSIGSQSIDGLGWKRNDAAFAQYPGGALNQSP
jgi:hypothetical protein